MIVTMDQSLEQHDSSKITADGEVEARENSKKSKKCNQCDHVSSRADGLRRHLKVHSGEESNKCNQCDYTSSQAGDLRTHLTTTVEKSQTNATHVTLHLLM